MSQKDKLTSISNLLLINVCCFLVPTSGFAYSLEALSEDEDVDDEDADEPRMERSTSITREQLTAALQVLFQLYFKLNLFSMVYITINKYYINLFKKHNY